MKLSLFALGLGLFLGLGACAAPSDSSDDGSSEGISGGTSEDAITSGDRKAQLEGLRARVQKDFANAPALRGYKLVFVVKRLNGDTKKAAIQAQGAEPQAMSPEQFSTLLKNEYVQWKGIVEASGARIE